MIERDSEKDRFLDDLHDLCSCPLPIDTSKARDLLEVWMLKDKAQGQEVAKNSMVQVSGIS